MDLVLPKNRFFAHPTFMGRPTSQHEIPLRTYSNIFGSFPELTDDLKPLEVEQVVKAMKDAPPVTKDWETIHNIKIFSQNLIFIPLLVWETLVFVRHKVYRMR
jgi:hypothetical protein